MHLRFGCLLALTYATWAWACCGAAHSMAQVYFHACGGYACLALTHNQMLVQFRDNLTARLQLLGQLHMKLPEDLNAAEQQLRDGDLPELDQQTQLLKRQIQVVTALDHMSSMCLHLTCSGLIGIGPHFYCAATHHKSMLQILTAWSQATIRLCIIVGSAAAQALALELLNIRSLSCKVTQCALCRL